ncbi:MAG: Ig-like domain-containing protein [Gemmatimonadota bacterium]
MALASCGGSDSTNSSPTIVAKASSSGDAQTAVVASTLPLPIRVLVTNGGAAQANITVNWATTGTGASMNPASSTTDVNGIATTVWILSQAAGAQSATAAVSGATGSPITFTATGTPDAPTAFTGLGGDAQSKAANAVFDEPLLVKISDQFGNPIAGQTVTWAVTSGSASVLPASGPTNAAGTASATLTAGATLGAVTVVATPPGGLAPITFNESVIPPPVVVNVGALGTISYTSAHNGTVNPAIDSVAVGGQVQWVWASGTHRVESTGIPAFTSGPTQSSGSYTVTFNTAGTYQYDCGIHGNLMTGTIVAH